MRDSDQFVAELRKIKVGPDDFLVTFDVVRLYPSIPHKLCIQLLTDYLNESGCTYTAFLMAILNVVLTENYCYFAGYYWKQVIGFATGVACGAEVAHLFLFALFGPVFSDARFSPYLSYYKMYIDDGVLIWSGPHALLLVMLNELDNRCEEIGLTWQISQEFLIFLDVRPFKGDGWRKTGILDTQVYQKEMNAYLYTPPTSEHPRHVSFGLIKGILLNYIKKSSTFGFFVEIAGLFYARLRARGYSSALLAEAFSNAPSYEIRESLLDKALAPRSTDVGSSNSPPVLVFSAVFSRSKMAAGLPRAIFLNQHQLPSNFPTHRRVNAWTVGKTLGAQLLTFRFPRSEEGFVRPAL